MNDDLKYDLVNELRAQFENKEVIKSNNKIQKYSEATKTLYADEETAMKKIPQFALEQEEEKTDDRTIDEMMAVFESNLRLKEDKQPSKRGAMALPTDKSVWHSNH